MCHGGPQKNRSTPAFLDLSLCEWAQQVVYGQTIILRRCCFFSFSFFSVYHCQTSVFGTPAGSTTTLVLHFLAITKLPFCNCLLCPEPIRFLLLFNRRRSRRSHDCWQQPRRADSRVKGASDKSNGLWLSLMPRKIGTHGPGIRQPYAL